MGWLSNLKKNLGRAVKASIVPPGLSMLDPRNVKKHAMDRFKFGARIISNPRKAFDPRNHFPPGV